MTPQAFDQIRALAPFAVALAIVIAAIVATVYGHSLAVPLLDAAARVSVPCECPATVADDEG